MAEHSPLKSLGRRMSSNRWRATGGQWRKAALDLLFPPDCAYCEVELPDRGGRPLLCNDCLVALAGRDEPRCERCGARTPPGTARAGRCPRCRKQPLRFETVETMGVYQDHLRAAVLRMKYRQQQPLVAAVGRLMAERLGRRLKSLDVDAVVPVPMFWMQRLARGTNSPETLAEKVAARLGRSCLPRALVRRRHTKRQTALPRGERWQNVRGAFRARRHYDLSGARLLLVDDVMTTGATCSEAARALRDAGAESVVVCVAARTDGPP